MRHDLNLTFALVLASLAASPAAASDEACLTSINGERQTLLYDPDEPNVKANTSVRERALGGPDGIECPGFVTLRAFVTAMNPNASYAEIEPFCLQYDPDLGTYIGIAAGDRDARLICKKASKSLCQHVNENAGAALAVAGLGSAVADGRDTAATAAGVVAVLNGSGAVILTGPQDYLSAAFATLGATALSVLTAPATLTARAVTVVVIGGATYACAE